MPSKKPCYTPGCENATSGIKPDSMCRVCRLADTAKRKQKRKEKQKALQKGKGTSKRVMHTQELSIRSMRLPKDPERDYAKAMRGKSYAE